MGNDDMNKVILFPEIEELQGRVQELKEQLTVLVEERDDIIHSKCKIVEMKYLLEIGPFEFKTFELQCKFLRLKRKIELIQARINHQEKIIIHILEATLDKEFEQFQQELEKRINEMNKAMDLSHSEFLSAEETKELKSAYREIVKVLHPDLNPDLSVERLELFTRAVEAYGNGDLMEIRLIKTLILNPSFQDKAINKVAALEEEASRLQRLIDEIKVEIQNYKSRYPMVMEATLKDPERKQELVDELEAQSKYFEEGIKNYSEKIEEMLR